MARMSIDDKFLRDPRVTMLANLIGESKYAARGRLLEIYALAYDRVDPEHPDPAISAIEGDLVGDLPGLIAAMVVVGLAAQISETLVRICGLRDRTVYLSSRERSGRLGGLKSGESRRNSSKQKTKVTFEKTKVTFPKNEGRANPLALVPDPASAPAPSTKNPYKSPKSEDFFVACPKRPSKKKSADVTAEERASAATVLGKLSGHNGVSYAGSAAHLRLIAGRLRDGLSEWDLRYVVGYCALELGWRDDPEMRGYLRPETLFGPQTITKYLEPARSWASKALPDRSPKTTEEQEAT